MRNRSEDQVKIVLLRHGATAGNREHRYIGETDEALSREGVLDLLKAKVENRYPKADYVFSSPMKRCRETAQILYPEKELIFIPEWKEMNFGDFEGKNYMELGKDERYQRWIDSKGTVAFPNGESREEFTERCKKGFYKMVSRLCEEKYGKAEGDIIAGLIVHGGTIMSLLSTFYGGEYFDYQVANGNGYICTLRLCKEHPIITEIQKVKEEK